MFSEVTTTRDAAELISKKTNWANVAARWIKFTKGGQLGGTETR